MKFFILNQEARAIAVNDYLKRADIELEFEQFVRRNALKQALVEPSNDKPAYLAHANQFGFNWEPNADGGHVQYNYKADLMKRLVEAYARELVHDLGLPVYEVGGANMFSLKHPVVEAYAQLYGDRLYQIQSAKSRVVMSYDASHPQFNLAAQSPISYKQLPFAHFSLADCYRLEQAGELMLLMRQRRFYMPDIHPYFKDIEQAFDWFPKMQAKIIEAGKAAKRNYQVVIEVPSDQIYHDHRGYIEQIPKWLGQDVLVNILNDGLDRYWVVNVDYNILDALGQSREIGCIQVDIGNAPRLGIEYIDRDGAAKHPVIIHSAIPGGIERYLYIMFDNFKAGLPDWIQPVQIRLLPVGGDYVKPCQKLIKELAGLPLRIEVDDRDVSLAAKLKLAYGQAMPYKLAIGQKEVSDDFAEARKLAKGLAGDLSMPFIKRGWPAEVSKQIG